MKYQVGDLVKYNKKVYRISGINENYRLPYKIEGELEDHFARDNNLIPIELTQKLLKLNGFELIYDGFMKSEYWTREDISRIVMSSTFDITINGLIGCAYVHELQQIARLLGYPDFADNFKIK